MCKVSDTLVYLKLNCWNFQMKLMRKMDELPVSDILFFSNTEIIKNNISCPQSWENYLFEQRTDINKTKGNKNKNKLTIRNTSEVLVLFQICLTFLLEDLQFLRCKNFCLEKKRNKIESRITSQIKLSLFLRGSSLWTTVIH